MRISPKSVAGARLMEWGVTERELRSARVFVWNWQKGGAVTLPGLPGNILILARSQYVVKDEKGELADDRALTKIRHEFCHVRQALEWGVFRYWFRHLRARVVTRSVLAAESDEESPCYRAEGEAMAAWDRIERERAAQRDAADHQRVS